MKLKGLGNRAYNVLFHTHTVAGIVISFALFIIFYAGAFALFRHEIYQWENPETRLVDAPAMDYDQALLKVDSLYQLDWHSITNVSFPTEDSPVMKVFGAIHDTDTTTERVSAYVLPGSYQVQDLKTPKTTVGDTIYYLHYFKQIPVIGLYISGFVALFFLFASITGILIHWRNLLNKFFAFITEGKWKQIWTNAHTVLGVIGLPFQVGYAVTGAFFGLLTFILLPSVLILYGGDSSKVFNITRPEGKVEVNHDAPEAKHLSIETLLASLQSKYPELAIENVSLRNYGKSDALATFSLDSHTGLTSSGRITMRMADGVIIPEASLMPYEMQYTQLVIYLISKLHFANFGGLVIKIVYFVLAMITCFMIISGVLIWRVARDTAAYSLKQRLFHHKVTKAYLAICLSLFPAFAILFIINKCLPMTLGNRIDAVNLIFFGSWLALTVWGLFWNSYARQNKNYLMLGGLLSLGVPLANGLRTGDWFWQTWQSLPRVAYVDIFWLFTGLLASGLALWVLKVPHQSDKPTEEYLAKTTKRAQPLVIKTRPNMPAPQLAIEGKKDNGNF